MDFEWDKAKSERCRRERGFSFADVLPAFIDPSRKIEVDNRVDYRETRLRLYGHVAGRLYVIVYTERGGVIRIISAHKANARERKKHGGG